MPDIKGGCYCGNIHLTVHLSKDLAAYNPRVCDCDFCLKHGAAYVSDARGSLSIRINDASQVNHFRQGSNTAEMLLCRNCGVLVGAVYRDEAQLFGTLNARALNAAFGPEQGVSPKSLAADDKIQRWRQLWFPHVSLGE